MKLNMIIKCRAHPRYMAKRSPRILKASGDRCPTCSAMFLAGIGEINQYDLSRLQVQAAAGRLRVTRG